MGRDFIHPSDRLEALGAREHLTSNLALCLGSYGRRD